MTIGVAAVLFVAVAPLLFYSYITIWKILIPNTSKKMKSNRAGASSKTTDDHFETENTEKKYFPIGHKFKAGPSILTVGKYAGAKAPVFGERAAGNFYRLTPLGTPEKARAGEQDWDTGLFWAVEENVENNVSTTEKEDIMTLYPTLGKTRAEIDYNLSRLRSSGKRLQTK